MKYFFLGLVRRLEVHSVCVSVSRYVSDVVHFVWFFVILYWGSAFSSEKIYKHTTFFISVLVEQSRVEYIPNKFWTRLFFVLDCTNSNRK